MHEEANLKEGNTIITYSNLSQKKIKSNRESLVDIVSGGERENSKNSFKKVFFRLTKQKEFLKKEGRTLLF